MKKVFSALAVLFLAGVAPSLAPADAHAAARNHAIDRGPVRAARPAAAARAQSPATASPSAQPFGPGYRWPYAKYDAQGNLVGPNPVLPGRW